MAPRIRLLKTPITPVNTGTAARGTSDFPAAEDHDHGITAGGMSIGGTVVGGTAGDILIVGAGPVLAQETPTTLAGTLDHGTLLGIADDDHALYLLASDATSRASFAANWLDLTDLGATTLHSHSGSTHAILDGSVHSDSVAQGVSRGSLIVGNSTPKWDELVVGTITQILGSDGTDAAWKAQSFIDHGSIGGLTDDDHAQYLLTSDATSRVAFAANWIDLTDAGTTTLHSHTVGAGTITNAMLANMAAWTFKIRNSGSSGVPSDAAVADLTASTPVAADFLIGYKADGTIRKYAASDFGVTGGGSVVASMGRTFLFMGA